MNTTIDTLPAKFNELCELRPLRPIVDEQDLDAATDLVNRLAILGKRTKDQDDYLDVLATLVEKYESDHWAIDASKVSGLRLLRSLMEEHEMSGSELGRLLGNRTLGPKILRGERELSKAHIRTLAEHFKVSPAVFLR